MKKASTCWSTIASPWKMSTEHSSNETLWSKTWTFASTEDRLRHVYLHLPSSKTLQEQTKTKTRKHRHMQRPDFNIFWGGGEFQRFALQKFFCGLFLSSSSWSNDPVSSYLPRKNTLYCRFCPVKWQTFTVGEGWLIPPYPL